MKMEAAAEVKKRVRRGGDPEFKAGFSPERPRDMLDNLWNVSCVLCSLLLVVTYSLKKSFFIFLFWCMIFIFYK